MTKKTLCAFLGVTRNEAEGHKWSDCVMQLLKSAKTWYLSSTVSYDAKEVFEACFFPQLNTSYEPSMCLVCGSDVDKFCEDSCDGLRSHEAWGKCLRVLNGKSMRLRALELAASAETKDAQSRIPLLSRLFQIRRTVKHFILVSTASSSFLQHQLLQVTCVIWLMIYNLVFFIGLSGGLWVAFNV